MQYIKKSLTVFLFCILFFILVQRNNCYGCALILPWIESNLFTVYARHAGDHMSDFLKTNDAKIED